MKAAPFVAAMCLGLAGLACARGPAAGHASAEVAATLASYRDAWLAGDPEAVLAHISDSIILYVPGRGNAPVIGKPAVTAHYFPGGDTTYPITRYEIHGQRIHVADQLAVAEGRSVLSWNTEASGIVLDSGSAASEYLTVLRREPDGWRIFRQMYVIR